MNTALIILFLLQIILFNVQSKHVHSFDEIRTETSDKTQTEAVEDLIKRLVPDNANKFAVIVDSSLLLQNNGKDKFQIESQAQDKILITASSGVAAATGFQHYLKYYCASHISWQVSQLNLPKILPPVNITVDLNDRFRYYQNVCTVSYSLVWYDWAQWEKHIDWMALNSFNLVLSFHGQEAIWNRVYQKLNLTEQDISEQFSGPAFLSWLRMGNLRGWGGPLSDVWHERSLVLQKLILKRMRDFGIIPVLPAFAGHLPQAFKRLYPDVNMVKTQRWNTFNDTYCCPYFLDPTDPLFHTIGKLFIEEQIAEYGTDHVYNCDSFNEINPSSTDLGYLGNVSASIFSSMQEADEKAVWIMQGWLFVYDFAFWTKDRAEALLSAVPKGKLIILDLQSEQHPRYFELDQYFGHAYIWCMLHNFGGTLGMYGSTDIINTEPIRARSATNSTMIGTGLTPEGINQNYVIYDLMMESAWRTESVDLDEWFANYTIRRYGVDNNFVQVAWKILRKSIYNFKGLEKMRGQYAITRTPSFKISIWTWYSYTDLFEAFDNFIRAAEDDENLQKSPGFLHDLVDITRQVLQVNGDIYFKEIRNAFNNKDVPAFNNSSIIFLDLFKDLELILATNEAFLLGPWVEAAKSCASNEEDKKLFEYNAKNQITLWGPTGEIMNYANKQWSGVVSDFFDPRWTLFLNYANETLVNNTKFNEAYIREKMFSLVEEPFTVSPTIFPTNPTGDTLTIARGIHKKWFQHARTARSNEEEQGPNVILLA